MEHKCKDCGKEEMPLGWPEDDLCLDCSRKPSGLDLQPCPFCGTDRTRLRDDFGAYVICECGCRGPYAGGPTARLIAVTMWNMRKSPNAPGERPGATTPKETNAK